MPDKNERNEIAALEPIVLGLKVPETTFEGVVILSDQQFGEVVKAAAPHILAKKGEKSPVQIERLNFIVDPDANGVAEIKAINVPQLDDVTLTAKFVNGPGTLKSTEIKARGLGKNLAVQAGMMATGFDKELGIHHAIEEVLRTQLGSGYENSLVYLEMIPAKGVEPGKVKISVSNPNYRPSTEYSEGKHSSGHDTAEKEGDGVEFHTMIGTPEPTLENPAVRPGKPTLEQSKATLEIIKEDLQRSSLTDTLDPSTIVEKMKNGSELTAEEIEYMIDHEHEDKLEPRAMALLHTSEDQVNTLSPEGRRKNKAIVRYFSRLGTKNGKSYMEQSFGPKPADLNDKAELWETAETEYSIIWIEAYKYRMREEQVVERLTKWKINNRQLLGK